MLGWVTPAKDQGSCGSCSNFAAVGAAETALIKAGANLHSMDLSEQWVAFCDGDRPWSKGGGNGGCTGGTAEHAAKILIRSGGVLVTESEKPYTAYDTDDCRPDDYTWWNPGYKLTDYLKKFSPSDEGE